MSDPLDAVFVTDRDEARRLKRSRQLAALAKYIDSMPMELKSLFKERFSLVDNAELAQLRADLQAAQERIADLTEHDARTLERCDVCGCALISDVLESDDEYSDPYCPACRCEELSIMLAEQARQTGRGAKIRGGDKSRA